MPNANMNRKQIEALKPTSPRRKAGTLKEALEKIIEKRVGRMIPTKKYLNKPLPADSAPYDNNGMNDHAYFNGPGGENVWKYGESRDTDMAKSLDFAPFYYEREWDKSGKNYVMVKKLRTQKG